LWPWNNIVVPIVNLAEEGIKDLEEMASKEPEKEDGVDTPFKDFFDS
jgi:hypothetical protein